MQYGQQAADEMRAKETLFKKFFQNVDVVMRQLNATQHQSKWDVSLSWKFMATQSTLFASTHATPLWTCVGFYVCNHSAFELPVDAASPVVSSDAELQGSLNSNQAVSLLSCLSSVMHGVDL